MIQTPPDSTKPKPVPKNWIDSEAHGKLVPWFTAVERSLSDTVAPIMQDAVDCAAIYHGNLADPRKKGEMWRSHMNAPYGFSGIETAVAAELDIALAPDPWVQAEGTGDEDQKSSGQIEKLLQHTLVVNDWPKRLQVALRNKRTFGTSIFKVDWEPRYSKVWIEVKDSELDAWELAASQAAALTGLPLPDPRDMSNEAYPGEQKIMFNMWRDIVSKAGFTIGDLPTSGWKNVLRSRCPVIRDVSMFNVRCDPRVSEQQDHEIYFERIITTKRWVWERSSDDPNSSMPFSREAVSRGLSGAPDWKTWDQQIATMLKVPSYQSSLWQFLDEGDQPVELYEVWRRNSEYPYCVMLNRSTIINRNPEELPHQHGMLPYTPIRNNPQAGLYFGISDLRPTKPVYAQMSRLLNLLTDHLTLTTIPIILKGRTAGLDPEAELNFRPGAFWNLSSADQVKRLEMGNAPVGDVFQFIKMLEQISDDTMSTPRQLRGAQSQIGRVSATESERRFSQGMQRQKMAATTTETELRPMWHQMLFLYAAHAPSEDRVNIGGRAAGMDVLANIPREDLIKALDEDFRLRGATLAANQGEKMQFVERFFQTGMSSQMLAPPEARKLLSILWRLGGMAGTVITEDGNAFAAAKVQREAQNAQAAASQASDPGTDLVDTADAGYDAQNATIEPLGSETDPATAVGSSTQAFE
mgnify:CR=1 FL=1